MPLSLGPAPHSRLPPLAARLTAGRPRCASLAALRQTAPRVATPLRVRRAARSPRLRSLRLPRRCARPCPRPPPLRSRAPYASCGLAVPALGSTRSRPAPDRAAAPCASLRRTAPRPAPGALQPASGSTALLNYGGEGLRRRTGGRSWGGARGNGKARLGRRCSRGAPCVRPPEPPTRPSPSKWPTVVRPLPRRRSDLGPHEAPCPNP